MYLDKGIIRHSIAKLVDYCAPCTVYYWLERNNLQSEVGDKTQSELKQIGTLALMGRQPGLLALICVTGVYG